MKTKLVRSSTDRMVSGVCGGLAAYLGIEAVWVRLFFVLISLANGVGLLVYLILWIIMPEVGREGATPSQTIESNVQEVTNTAQQFAQNIGQAVQSGPNRQAGIIVGAALIVLGVVFLLDTFHILAWFRFDQLWPLILILGGLALLVNRVRGA
jgi:phage shock protein PspC (stress-responsive transcriptional regulator)